MKTVLRWFAGKDDSVSFGYLGKMLAVTGIVSHLQDIPAGQVWPAPHIRALKEQINSAGFTLDVIESLNPHDDIILGAAQRDQYIAGYRTNLRLLGEAGIKVICYTFTPPPANDREINEAQLLQNLKCFLEAVIPVCCEWDIRLAIHPDDPCRLYPGSPRIVRSREQIERILKLVDSPYNGLTFCVKSFGADPAYNIPKLIRHFGRSDRIHFAHVRNIQTTEEPGAPEAGRKPARQMLGRSEIENAQQDIDIMKAFRDVGYQGYICPEHNRTAWSEPARLGYNLYDRAMGIMYLNGLREAIGEFV